MNFNNFVKIKHMLVLNIGIPDCHITLSHCLFLSAYILQKSSLDDRVCGSHFEVS